MHFLQVLPQKYHEIARSNFEKSIRGEPKSPYEVEYLTSDGRSIFVEVNTKPIIKDGKFLGVLGVSRDITRRKKAEKALKESEEVLGRNAFDLIAPEDRDKAYKHLQNTYRAGFTRNAEYNLLRKDP